MHDVIEQAVMYVRGVWRYRWYALLLGWIIVLSGWVYVTRLPDQYEATARVYVDTDSILRPLLRGLTVQTNVDQRVQLLTRTLFSRPNMEKVARMTDVDIKAKTPEAMEALINQLSANIRLASKPQERNLYNISYEHEDAQTAKRIVQAVLTIFVESSLGEARKDTDVAQKFLEQQIEDYEARLVEAENRLTEFKRQNLGFLPGQGGDFFARLQSAQAEQQLGALQLREAQKIRDELAGQLAEVEDLEEEMSVFVDTPVTSSLDGRIQVLQAKLDELLLRYTEQHPDVIELRSTIAALEAQRAEEVKALSKQTQNSRRAVNPMYQQIKVALGQANANVAAAEVRVKEYAARVAELKRLVDILPQVETELNRLNRDYSVNKQNYEELLSRRESAKMSEEAEQMGDNVSFRVIDPPRVPLSPSGPNRPLLSALVLLAGIGIGWAVAFLLSQANPAVFNRRALQQLTGLPVFGSISRVWTPQQLRRARLWNGAFAFGAAMMVFACAGVVTMQGYELGKVGTALRTVVGWL